MNRRQFLTRSLLLGAAATAPGLIVPERRSWQLDQTMTTPPSFEEDFAREWMRQKTIFDHAMLYGPDTEFSAWLESLTPRTTPLLDRMPQIAERLNDRMLWGSHE